MRRRTLNRATSEITRAAYNKGEAFSIGIGDSGKAVPGSSSVSGTSTTLYCQETREKA